MTSPGVQIPALDGALVDKGLLHRAEVGLVEAFDGHDMAARRLRPWAGGRS